MLCERCNENEATVHLTQVVDGAVQKLHLCEACASEAGFDLQGPVSITDILLGMGGPAAAEPEEESTRICRTCRLTLAEFRKRGRLGCPDCYTAFAPELASLLKAVHHSDQHIGKVPTKEGARVRITAEIAALRKELDRAVAEENYEQAAKLRDKIQSCRARMDDENKKAGS